MTAIINRIWHDEEGATAIEYALIAALIAVACSSALIALGNELVTTFEYITSILTAANA